MLYACCIAGEQWMLLTERPRVLLWSSVMSVNCTLICAVENFSQSCEKTQTVFIFLWYGKIQHMSKDKVFAYRLTPYSLDECCIFQYRTQMNTICISCSMYTTCIHVVQGSAVLADTDIRLTVKAQPVSVRIEPNTTCCQSTVEHSRP